MATNDAFREQIEANLKAWDSQLEHLKAQAHLASENARVIYENELEELERQRVKAQQMLQDLGTRSGNAWEEMRQGVEKAWLDLSQSLAKVSSHFK